MVDLLGPGDQAHIGNRAEGYFLSVRRAQQQTGQILSARREGFSAHDGQVDFRALDIDRRSAMAVEQGIDDDAQFPSTHAQIGQPHPVGNDTDFGISQIKARVRANLCTGHRLTDGAEGLTADLDQAGEIGAAEFNLDGAATTREEGFNQPLDFTGDQRAVAGFGCADQCGCQSWRAYFHGGRHHQRGRWSGGAVGLCRGEKRQKQQQKNGQRYGGHVQQSPFGEGGSSAIQLFLKENCCQGEVA